jgi:hypothetical protein
MGAFLSISLWVALATVVPGMISIAVVYALGVPPSFLRWDGSPWGVPDG